MTADGELTLGEETLLWNLAHEQGLTAEDQKQGHQIIRAAVQCALRKGTGVKIHAAWAEDPLFIFAAGYVMGCAGLLSAMNAVANRLEEKELNATE